MLSPMPIQMLSSATLIVRRPMRTASAALIRSSVMTTDVGGLTRCGRATGAHRNADVGNGQHGGVIDAVTNHHHQAFRMLLYRANLVLWKAFGQHVVDAELGGDVVGSGLGVTGEDHR